MLRSSHGSRRVTPWAIAQKPRPPRVVRLGRAANDNARQPTVRARLLAVSLAAVLAAMAIVDWLLL